MINSFFVPNPCRLFLSRLLLLMALLIFPQPGSAEETADMPAFLLGSDSGSAAEAANTLRGVVQRGIAGNPEVKASWEAFQATRSEQYVAKGGYFPRLDLSSRLGHERFHSNGSTSEFDPAEASLTLTQMIFDGFSTSNEVKRLGHETLARYYDLLEVSEATALEIVTAYIDLLRYRELLGFAEDNLKKHDELFQQVQDRFNAGVGRGVDLEQATGRLALARSNRITESNNLHDVSTRFLRLVGELPSTNLAPPTDLSRESIPGDIETALQRAFENNPAFNAAFERVYAAEKAKEVRHATYLPRLELRARYETGTERDRLEDHSHETGVELALDYNLFRGGSDRAAITQFSRLVNQAKDLRVKACRDVRQTLTIAYSDIRHLEKQLVQLKQHYTSTANARDAYRDQFDIGQRTLLDLLDTENEFFQARRAYTIASYDYVLAHSRTLAGMGKLLAALGAREGEIPSMSSPDDRRAEDRGESFCPAQAVPDSLYDVGSSIAESSVATAFAPELDVDHDGDGIPFSLDQCPDTPPGMTVDAQGCVQQPPPGKAVAVPAYPRPEKLDKIDINFEHGKNKIPEKFFYKISRLAKLLQEHPETSILLDGHTDSTGDRAYNETLSRNRVEAVRERLIQKYQVSPDRIYVSWFNADNPVSDNSSREGRSKNRRVEAHVSIVLKGLTSKKLP